MLLRILLIVVLSIFSTLGLACDLNHPTPVSGLLPGIAEAAPRQILLSNNAMLSLPQAEGVLQLHRADNQALLAELNAWPTASSRISPILAQPALLDSNYDGVADAVYVVDIAGLVWYIPLTAAGFATPQLLADLSSMQGEFRQPLQVVQTMSVSGAGRSLYRALLLINSHPGGSDSLIMLKHRLQSTSVLQPAELHQRTDLTIDELNNGISQALWQQMQSGPGWYIRLSGQITVVPKVYGGVVYITAADTVAADCSVPADAELSLYALHLHHGGAVYAWRQQSLRPLQGQLVLIQTTENGLELVIQSEQEQHTLLSELVQVTEGCGSCIEALDAAEFPKLKRLATYSVEPEAH